jgi:hypothetical protein
MIAVLAGFITVAFIVIIAGCALGAVMDQS